MTRSDDPFGDLPEWKERRRLMETQGLGGGQPGNYQAPHEPGLGAPANLYPQHDDGGYRQPQDGYPAQPAPQQFQQFEHAAPHAPVYSENSQGHDQQSVHGQSGRGYAGGQQEPLHYQTAPGQQVAQGYQPHAEQHTGEPNFDAYQHGHYGGETTGQPGAGYATAPAPQDYGAPQQAGEFDLAATGFRGGQYDNTGGYQPANGYGAPSYDPGQVVPDHQPAGIDHAPVYGDPNQQSSAAWHDDTLPGVGAQNAVARIGADEDDDEYDDYEDEPQRYSWKLLAAVVVTGAVVAGGGVVLYDSFATGGASQGKAPIIRAQKGPAKTAPKDAGGRKFAHSDSKLLGRLDNSRAANGATRQATEEGGNRVRTVPTVPIGRDGRLLLPKAPEAVNSPSAQSANAAASSSQQVPGINVVDSLNGGGNALGNLPPALPPTQTSGEGAQSAAPKASAPAIKPSVISSTATKPVIKNRDAVNQATLPSNEPPPVPGKSAVGTAWRMTGATSQQPQRMALNRPTVTQRRQPARTAPAKRSTPAPAAPSSGAARGYVAVLATESSRMKALQSFAELQQKHPKALVNRVPDVQKADLQARGLGIMYRVVVGPAGSRSEANSVCASLKAEGYTGCWVKAN